MNKVLEKAAQRIAQNDQAAYIRRVMWLDMEERVKNLLNELKVNSKACAAFGSFYFTSSQNYEPYASKSFIYRLNSLNQIQISTGHRITGIYKAKDAEHVELISEKGSALWFSQDISGRVMVFLAPYKSSIHEVNEKNVIIGNYKDPNCIHRWELARIIRIFLHYCEATMFYGAYSKRLNWFRGWLQFKEIRNRKRIRRFVLKVLGQALALLLAGLGIIATLYAGGKL